MKKFEFSERVKLYLRNSSVIAMIKEVEKELPKEFYELFIHIGDEVKSSDWFPKELKLYRDEYDLIFYKKEWEFNDEALCFCLEKYYGKEKTIFEDNPYIGIYVPEQIADKVSPIIQQRLGEEADEKEYDGEDEKQWPIWKNIYLPQDTDDPSGFIAKVIEEFKWLFTKIEDIDNILKEAGILKKK